MLPDCDLFDFDAFKEACKEHQNAQNPCDCGSFISCGTDTVLPCGGGSFFSPCVETCVHPQDMRNCPKFCMCQREDMIVEHGAACPTTTTTTPGPGSENNMTITLAIVLPIIAIVLVVCTLLGWLLWRRRIRWAKTPDRHPTPWYQALCILPFFPCSVCKNKIETKHHDWKDRRNKKDGRFSFHSNGFSESSEYSDEKMTSSSINMHVYRDAKIFPLEMLHMGQTLGRGAYGKVFKGWLALSSELKVEVAVKTSTRSTGASDIEREAKVFLKLKQKHMNIVNILGVCLPSDNHKNPLLLLELCEV